MAETQTVIIDFQADFTQLEEAITTLEKAGKVDSALAAQFKKANQEIKAQGDAFNKVSQSANKETQSLSKLHQLLQQFPKTGMNRFLLQVGNELAAAGIKAEDFFKKAGKEIKPTEQKFSSLRQELRAVREQMQQAALTGGVLSEEYKKLKQRAGELDDTIKDVGSDIANAGSDTRGIDNVVGSISALAGGFSAVQGAAALFGDESEDLQKALLKVNAAMAIANGIQQVSNALTKQGAITRLADVTATGLQIAAQKIYTFVTGRATQATILFTAALAATGIGLLIIGIVALVNALKDSNEEIEGMIDNIDKLKAANEGFFKSITREEAEEIALLQARGAKESEVSKLRLGYLEQRIRKEKEAFLAAKQLLEAANQEGKITKEVADIFTQASDAYRDSLSERRVLTSQITKQQIDEAKEAADKQKELNEKAAQEAKKLRQKEFDDFVAKKEREFILTKEGTRQRLSAEIAFLRAKLQADLNNEDLTQNQRKLLIQKYFNERKELEKKFAKELIDQASENERNLLQAQLANLSISEEKKLELKIEFLRLTADAEVREAEGNAAKIKLINAQLNADIAAAKIESIRKTAEDEARLLAATGGGARRALEATAQNERFKADIRINAIRQLGQIEIAAIDKQIAANRIANEVVGADHNQLNIEYAELQDQKLAKAEEIEKRITDLTLSENEKRKQSDIAYIQATVGALNEIGSILSGIATNEQQAAEQAISSQRRRIDELLEAGAITEKEAEKRNKKIDAEERAAKNRAAQQQKSLAVFNAVLAIPQAFIAGLTAPFPIGGPIYAAVLAGLAAAQAAVIASRPVPKFATGKKGSYSGLGEVGEVGAELIQRGDGSMEVATKRTLVYLGPKDKVFTASETKQMMPFVNKEAIEHTSKQENINYDKIAQAIIRGYKPSPGTNINIDKDGITTWTTDQLERVHYHQKYYSSK